MMISALVDAGLPFEKIEAVLKSLPLVLPRISPVKKQLGTVEGIHLQIDDCDLHLQRAPNRQAMRKSVSSR
jgi:uncharacterized protein (DUF111 family)